MFRVAILAVLLFPVFALAAPVTLVDQESSFDIDLIEEVAQSQQFLGELDGFPHTWQFVVSDEVPLWVQLQVADEALQNLSLIVIKEERRGVSEVGRIEGKKASWELVNDRALGFNFFSNGRLEAELATGVYRLEVSAPNNVGKYRLRIGQTPGEGQFLESARNAIAIHRWFGVGAIGALAASSVYIPLLSLVGIYALGRLYRRYKSNHA